MKLKHMFLVAAGVMAFAAANVNAQGTVQVAIVGSSALFLEMGQSASQLLSAQNGGAKCNWTDSVKDFTLTDVRPIGGTPAGAAVTDFRVRKSIKLMSESPGAEIELDSIARESGLSRPHFYRLFRSQTGVTPHLYLNTLIMEQALDALVATEAPITDIGFDLGFSSQSVFTRFFAAHVGLAPSEYRRAAKVLRS